MTEKSRHGFAFSSRLLLCQNIIFLELSIIVSKVFFLFVSAAFRKNSKYRHLLLGRAKKKKTSGVLRGFTFRSFSNNTPLGGPVNFDMA